MTPLRSTLPIRPAPSAAAPAVPASPAPHEPGRPWTLAEASAWLSVSEKTLTRALAAGRLVAVQGVGRRVLLTDSSVRAMAEGR